MKVKLFYSTPIDYTYSSMATFLKDKTPDGFTYEFPKKGRAYFSIEIETSEIELSGEFIKHHPGVDYKDEFHVCMDGEEILGLEDVRTSTIYEKLAALKPEKLKTK